MRPNRLQRLRECTGSAVRAALACSLTLLVVLPARGERVDGVAAVVGDEVILISEVEEKAAPLIQRMREEQQGDLPGGAVRKLMEDAVQALIDERLVLEMARRMNLETTDEDVDHAVASIAREEGMSPEQVYEQVERQGLTRERYREQMGNEIAKMRVVQNVVRSRVAVTDEEVNALYEKRYANLSPGVRVRSRHILVPWPEKGGADARREIVARVAGLREEIVGGADFATLARRYSVAPSAARGGLTEFREGEVAAQLASFVFSSEPGSLSPVIQTEHGANLLLIVDRYDPSDLTLEQVAPGLRAEIREQKSIPEYEKWLAELRENQYVEVIAPELR